MDDLTRRAMLRATGFAGMMAIVGVTAPAASGAGDRANAQPEQDPEAKPDLPPFPEADKKRVMACGFTEAEANCWNAVNEACTQYFNLPKLHVMDDHELAHAFHVLQYRLMMRPAYRQYQALVAAEKKK
jgi:hypothetical protein